jgi:hypothetical protein
LVLAFDKLYIIPFRFQRISFGEEEAPQAYCYSTLRKPTTLPTKLAKESKLVSDKTQALFLIDSREIIVYYENERRANARFFILMV